VKLAVKYPAGTPLNPVELLFKGVLPTAHDVVDDNQPFCPANAFAIFVFTPSHQY